MAEAVSTDAASGAAAKESKGKHKAPKIELSGAQKAAAVIVALGAEKASLLYKYMEPDDVEPVSYTHLRKHLQCGRIRRSRK